MAEGTIRFRCPCCHKQLEIETSTGEVQAVDKRKEAAERSGEEIDAMVDKHRHESERLHDAFSKAADEVRTHKDTFDDLLKNALDEAKKDKDEKPRNPFDFD